MPSNSEVFTPRLGDRGFHFLHASRAHERILLMTSHLECVQKWDPKPKLFPLLLLKVGLVTTTNPTLCSYQLVTWDVLSPQFQ